MYLGYNTNGLAHHDPFEAVELLDELGYRGVALTLNHLCLSPFSLDLRPELRGMRAMLDERGMRSVVETGARFLLDPRVKHEPTLMSPLSADRQRRVEFYCRAVEIASELGSDCVSLWSGILRDEIDEAAAFERLIEGLEPVVDYAAKYEVKLGFEPEPGMFIDTMKRYDRLLDLLDAPHFLLTLDVGHLHCQGETPIADVIRRYGSRLVNVHIEDMRADVHEHLPFGEGEMDFPPIVAALEEVGYTGGLYVELSRHSHDGPNQAWRSMRFLQPLMKS